MENYQCHITINNRTTERLRLVRTDLPWGRFRDGPVPEIGPKEERKAFVATGSIGPAGTEGTVVYQLGDDTDVTVSVYFDIPTRPFSRNTVTADASDEDVSAKVDGLNGGGATESCTIRVIDGR